MTDSATLRPSPTVTGPWTVVGVVATVLALWVALDVRSNLIAWLFVALCLVVTSYVAIQLATPGRFAVVLDDDGIEVSLPWQHDRIPWDRVHLARVIRVIGEPVLEVHAWDPGEVTRRSPQPVGILLPMGADLPTLHRVLEARLGRYRQPGTDPVSN